MSEIKVNKISPRTACGTTTLGDSGDTFTIPSGVTITNNGTANGFGATGAVNWQPSSIKTSTFTAVAGEGYFVDTSSGGFTVNLPAGTAGAVVGFSDYAKTFDTGNLTLDLNGTDKAAGSTVNPKLIQEGIAVTLVFVDSTKGWIVTDSGLQTEANQAEFISATGGTITTVCTNFKVHTFTGPGTFCVSAAGNACGSNTVDYLVVAGGGGGGVKYGAPYNENGGGAGAGGYRESSGAASGCYTRSPLGACVSALPVAVTGYPVTVGGGGTGGTGSPYVIATNGSNSIFAGTSTITSAGGGLGGSSGPSGGGPEVAGGSGGSGGGGAARAGSAGAGNTPPVSPPQGNNGNNSENNSPPFSNSGSGGGGGATAVGGRGGTPCNPGTTGGDGGAGATSSINGTPTARAGGGGGSGDAPGCGGAGGGGKGGGSIPGFSGTANTGGGGGGSGKDGSNNPGGAGGSGIVIIRYKFQ